MYILYNRVHLQTGASTNGCVHERAGAEKWSRHKCVRHTRVAPTSWCAYIAGLSRLLGAATDWIRLQLQLGCAYKELGAAGGGTAAGVAGALPVRPRRPPPLFPPSRLLLEPRSFDEDVWLNFVMAGGATNKRLVLALGAPSSWAGNSSW
jgi:hypothetical protein